MGHEVFASPTMSYPAPCVLVFLTSSLDLSTTTSPSSYTTSHEYGAFSIMSTNRPPTIIFLTSTMVVTVSIPPITLEGLPISNVNATSNRTTPVIIYQSVDILPVALGLPTGSWSTASRMVSLPPWLLREQHDVYTAITSAVTTNGLTATTVTFPPVISPATTEIAFATPPITARMTCTNSAPLIFTICCPSPKVVALIASTTTTDVLVDRSLVTIWSLGQAAYSTTTPVSVSTTWPPYGRIIPVTTTVDKPEPTSDGVFVYGQSGSSSFSFLGAISTSAVGTGSFLWASTPLSPHPSASFNGHLASRSKITIGNDNQITTEDEPECQTQTAEPCTTTTFFSATTTTTATSTSSYCETISGCSISGSNSSNTSTIVTVGTQTIAPIGTWTDESWTNSGDDAYSSSVFAALSRDLTAELASNDGSVISFTPGPTASPTCASGTCCGGQLCTGYWHLPSPTGYPLGYQDPKDPRSGGYAAPTTMIGQTPAP
ncbi:hypothetical protein F4823DRAFT_631522 [Ustulina deusta]|nr:hypothetical protein F4823DRAFT_631522 [Ustulina deusta]